MKLRVVLLAAGAGFRMSTNYPVPKQFLPIDGSTPFQSCCDLALRIDPNPVRVCSTAVVSGLGEEVRFGSQGAFRDVQVDVLQQGPVMSALLAGAHISPDDPVLFFDTDSYFPNPQEIATGVKNLSPKVLDGFDAYVLVANAKNHPTVDDPLPFSRVYRASSSGIAPVSGFISSHELASSPYVNIGAYCFSSWQLFLKSTLQLISKHHFQLKDEVNFVDVMRMLKSASLNIVPSLWFPAGTVPQYEAARKHFGHEAET